MWIGLRLDCRVCDKNGNGKKYYDFFWHGYFYIQLRQPIWILSSQCLGDHRKLSIFLTCIKNRSYLDSSMTLDFKHLIVIETYIDYSSLKNINVHKGRSTLVTGDHDHRILKPLVGWEMSGGLTLFCTSLPKIEVTTGENVTTQKLRKWHKILQVQIWIFLVVTRICG